MFGICACWTAAIAVLMFILPCTMTASAQTFQVIHTFTGGTDGSQPTASLLVDNGGNLYGTASDYAGPGSVFEIKKKNGQWTFSTLYTFGGIGSGIIPQGAPVFGPGGAIYLTTTEGGSGSCGEFACGTVYSLRAPRTICLSVSCPWSATRVYSFNGNDGYYPWNVAPAFDSAGNIYGTTTQGGASLLGNVFELKRSADGSWTGTSIHDFDGNDGQFPFSGVILDSAGNVYGTVPEGGANGYGAVYRVSRSGSGWTESTLYSFTGFSDGAYPYGALIMDQAGNLYGATIGLGREAGGTVFKLSPSGGGWNFTLLYSLPGGEYGGPQSALLMDSAGNLYGTGWSNGSHGDGVVFKLTYDRGGYTYSALHEFTGGADGANPSGGVSMDANGNLFGTTVNAGQNNNGVVWEIVP